MMIQTGTVGNRAENKALQYLKKRGLQCKERNFHSRYGEIDLICLDKDVIVFVEVRYRKNQQFGGAVASITNSKIQKIRKTAALYIQKLKLQNQPCRFDVLCLTGDLKKPQFDWLKNAF